MCRSHRPTSSLSRPCIPLQAEGDLDIDAELLAAIAASEAADRDAGASAHVVRDGMAQFEAVVGVGGRVAEYVTALVLFPVL